ncbi:MAG: hypothetical protein C0507_18205 [Cyanobacteria bacterium PR.3.49]|nr:hypothetical protein [Cyanobacteria bacterium PR.3.49]
MKVLIAFDDSPYSQKVINQILRSQWRPHVTFKVLMILEPICISTEFGDQETADAIEKIYKKRWHYASKVCESVVQRLKASISECSAEYEVKEGTAGKEIVNAAVSWHADKVILGAHGFGICPRNILGSVSTYVAAHAPCSIEIIRSQVSA